MMLYSQLPFFLTKYFLDTCMGWFPSADEKTRAGRCLDVAIAWGALNAEKVIQQAGGPEALKQVLEVKARSLSPGMLQ